MEDVRYRDASDTNTQAEWLARLQDIGDELGYFERLGKRHAAFFTDDSPILLVTFETIGAIRGATEGQMPLGFRIARANGWSHLSIIADGETWYRDPALYGYFDRLVDDAFFEDFDRVVFYGAGQGGYAAAAYSVTAPGATVVAAQPIATLDPSVTEWDDRFKEHRRLNFTDRYGYAPDMIDGAAEVFVVYDPEEPLDAMQAALFTRPFVTKLRCRNLGEAIEPALQHMDILAPVLAEACRGILTPQSFYRLYRARHGYRPYLRTLMERAESQGRLLLAALVARQVATHMDAPRFRRKLRDLEVQLERRGVALPPVRDILGADPIDD